MKNKWLYLLVVIVFLLQFKIIDSNDKNSLYVETSILSDQFENFYKFCGNNDKEIIIYNETNTANNLELNKCDKKIIVKKINFEYDVNIPMRRQSKRKIILYKLTKNEKSVKLYYLSIPDNSTLIFEYNDKLELIDLLKGAF